MLRRLLDRPIAVTMVTVVLLILGVVGARLLPVSLVPDVDAPGKEHTCQFLTDRLNTLGFDLWVGKISWRRMTIYSSILA